MSLQASSPIPATHRDATRQAPAGRFSSRRLIPATGAALVASLLGVLAIRAAAVSGTSDTSRFSPLQPASVISLTVAGVLLAAATCLWLNRISDRPVVTFRSIALIALPLSFIPDAAIWLSAHYPQTRAATVLPLMAMHILVAIVCLTVLPRLGQAQTGK
jgi:hypothetical protein